MLRTPSGGTVKIIERGKGTAAVFLHSGVGSAGEWREVFSRWPQGYRLIAVDAYRDGTGPGRPGQRTLDDYADQVHAVVNHVGEPVHLIGFSWGGATGLHMAVTTPEVLASLTVVEPEAYSLLRTEHAQAFAEIAALRDRWCAHVRADRWHVCAGWRLALRGFWSSSGCERPAHRGSSGHYSAQPSRSTKAMRTPAESGEVA